MRRMAKCLAVLLALSLLLTTAAFAADGTADKLIVSAGEVNAKAGDSVTVPIEITQNPGFVAALVRITYDADALTLQTENGVVNKEVVPGLNFLPNAQNAGTVTVLLEKGDATANITETGTWLELNFTVAETAAAADYAIGVAVQQAKNYAREDVSATVQNGKVTVQATITEPQEDVVTGASITYQDTDAGKIAFSVSNSTADADATWLVFTSTDGGGNFATWTKVTASNGTYTVDAETGLTIHVYLLGDQNKDGVMDVGDTSNILKAIANSQSMTGLNKALCDFDGSGVIDVGDTANMLKAIAN